MWRLFILRGGDNIIKLLELIKPSIQIARKVNYQRQMKVLTAMFGTRAILSLETCPGGPPKHKQARNMQNRSNFYLDYNLLPTYK